MYFCSLNERRLTIINAMLVLSDIYKSFGETLVLAGVNICIESGKIYTIVGGNGSGKTTLFNIISGFIKPDRGSIIYNNSDITVRDPYKINRLGIGRTFQDLRLANKMTVRENIIMSAEQGLFESPQKQVFDKVDDILHKLSLSGKANELAGEISYGQQKLLTLACLIANDAQLLLIDEPVAGIDKVNYEKITNLIVDLKKEGKTIIQIEHNHAYIERTSDLILKMEKGVVVC